MLALDESKHASAPAAATRSYSYASKIRPTCSGQIAVEVASEAETKEAIDRLYTVARVTGYTARGIPNKHARLTNPNLECTK